jgi:hypothetical protein
MHGSHQHHRFTNVIRPASDAKPLERLALHHRIAHRLTGREAITCLGSPRTSMQLPGRAPRVERAARTAGAQAAEPGLVAADGLQRGGIGGRPGIERPPPPGRPRGGRAPRRGGAFGHRSARQPHPWPQGGAVAGCRQGPQVTPAGRLSGGPAAQVGATAAQLAAGLGQAVPAGVPRKDRPPRPLANPRTTPANSLPKASLALRRGAGRCTQPPAIPTRGTPLPTVGCGPAALRPFGNKVSGPGRDVCGRGRGPLVSERAAGEDFATIRRAVPGWHRLAAPIWTRFPALAKSS